MEEDDLFLGVPVEGKLKDWTKKRMERKKKNGRIKGRMDWQQEREMEMKREKRKEMGVKRGRGEANEL